MTNPPTSLFYSSVVSRDRIRLAFLLATLNDIDIPAAEVGNVYLNAPTKEKVYTTASPEYGTELQGRYGLKSSAADWRAGLANTLHTMGLTSSLADPDVWFCPAVNPDGFQYFEYALVYAEDFLALSTIKLRKFYSLYQISIILRKDMTNQLTIWELKKRNVNFQMMQPGPNGSYLLNNTSNPEYGTRIIQTK